MNDEALTCGHCAGTGICKQGKQGYIGTKMETYIDSDHDEATREVSVYGFNCAICGAHEQMPRCCVCNGNGYILKSRLSAAR